MSTRSQIRFTVKSKDRHHKTNEIHESTQTGLTYRHSDGYPSGALPDLIAFLKWNGFRNNDLEYTAANWVFFQKRRGEEWNKNDSYDAQRRKKEGKKPWTWDKAEPNISILHTGYGICFDNVIHGDIEYYYEVIHEIDSAAGPEERVSCEIHCYKLMKTPIKPDGGWDWEAERKVESEPFAKVIFKPGDYKYVIQKIVGLNKEFKEPEEIAA